MFTTFEAFGEACYCFCCWCCCRRRCRRCRRRFCCSCFWMFAWLCIASRCFACYVNFCVVCAGARSLFLCIRAHTSHLSRCNVYGFTYTILCVHFQWGIVCAFETDASDLCVCFFFACCFFLLLLLLSLLCVVVFYVPARSLVASSQYIHSLSFWSWTCALMFFHLEHVEKCTLLHTLHTPSSFNVHRAHCNAMQCNERTNGAFILLPNSSHRACVCVFFLDSTPFLLFLFPFS